jgi:hypothetical protein
LYCITVKFVSAVGRLNISGSFISHRVSMTLEIMTSTHKDPPASIDASAEQ